MQQFRGGLVFKAHRLLYHSTLGLRVHNKVTGLASWKFEFPFPGGLISTFLSQGQNRALAVLYEPSPSCSKVYSVIYDRSQNRASFLLVGPHRSIADGGATNVQNNRGHESLESWQPQGPMALSGLDYLVSAVYQSTPGDI